MPSRRRSLNNADSSGEMIASRYRAGDILFRRSRSGEPRRGGGDGETITRAALRDIAHGRIASFAPSLADCRTFSRLYRSSLTFRRDLAYGEFVLAASRRSIELQPRFRAVLEEIDTPSNNVSSTNMDWMCISKSFVRNNSR